MTYEFDGKKYEQASAPQKEWGTRLIAELALQGHERVLDLGCGDGALTAKIAELLPRGSVVGIDASRGMIEAALPKVQANLEFLLMDIDEIPFTGDFDAVFSNATLHWVKDHERLIQNLRRCLRPGGRVRLNFAARGNCPSFLTAVHEAMAQPGLSQEFTRFEWPWYMTSVAEYEALVAAGGLDGARVWGERADTTFPDTEALVRWIDQPGIVPFVAHLPEEKRQAFREYVIGRTIELTRQGDGSCLEIFRRINVSSCPE